jgi:hypothetical protein
MSAIFKVVDLTQTPTPLAGGPGVGEVDLDRLRGELEQIRDGLTPVMEEQDNKAIKLKEIEIDLSISLEGNLWFIAKGKGEASIRVQFARD